MLCWSHVDDKTALTRRGVDSTQSCTVVSAPRCWTPLTDAQIGCFTQIWIAGSASMADRFSDNIYLWHHTELRVEISVRRRVEAEQELLLLTLPSVSVCWSTDGDSCKLLDCCHDCHSCIVCIFKPYVSALVGLCVSVLWLTGHPGVLLVNRINGLFFWRAGGSRWSSEMWREATKFWLWWWWGLWTKDEHLHE